MLNDEQRARVKAEADRRWPHTGDADVDTIRAMRRLTFYQGAEWASADVEIRRDA